MPEITKIESIITEIFTSSENSDPAVYAHIITVSRFCGFLALRRGVDSEKAVAAGLLHDVYTLKTGISEAHALRGGEMARELLSGIYPDEVIDEIAEAVSLHSAKTVVHFPLAEVLKDADTLAHVMSDLADPSLEVRDSEKDRLARLKEELGFTTQP
jgi:uncharacterized protein